MFTGLVQAVGTMVWEQPFRISVSYPQQWIAGDPIQLGESIAINGCCLTVVKTGERLEFELSQETLNRTTFGKMPSEAMVNLERAAKIGDRIGGHLVQGHVDAVSKVLSIRPNEDSSVYEFSIPEGGQKYLVSKGSVTLDGISLTVVEPNSNSFFVWVIPHTLAETNLKARAVGDSVNLEYDMVSKHVEHLLTPYLPK